MAHAIKAHTALARMDGPTQGAASQEIHLVEVGSAEKLVPAAGSASARHANLSRQPHLHHVAHVAAFDQSQRSLFQQPSDRLTHRSAGESEMRGNPKNLGLSGGPVREAVRRLLEKGALRLIERSNMGHVVEVRLPGEVRVPGGSGAGSRDKLLGGANLDKVDFLRSGALRRAIHAREGGVCFYCMRHTPSRAHCLDHVVPLAEGGSNSYRNLVSWCMGWNL